MINFWIRATGIFTRFGLWAHNMMTSSNGNIFRVTGHLCREFTGEFPAQMPVTRSFDVFFDLRLNQRLSKQWWGWWFETLPCPLWRHCNEPFVKWVPVTAWINKHMYSVVWGEIDYSFPNFNGYTSMVGYGWVIPPLLYNGCDYLSMLGLKSIHVDKRAPGVCHATENAIIEINCYTAVYWLY